MWTQRVTYTTGNVVCFLSLCLPCTGDCLILKYFTKSWVDSSKGAVGGSYLSTQAYLTEIPTEESTGGKALMSEGPLEIGCRLKLSLQFPRASPLRGPSPVWKTSQTYWWGRFEITVKQLHTRTGGWNGKQSADYVTAGFCRTYTHRMADRKV